MSGKHRRYPTRRQTVLEWWAVRRKATHQTRRVLVADALARGWHFYVDSPAGSPEPVKGASRVVAVSMAAPRALWMERELG